MAKWGNPNFRLNVSRRWRLLPAWGVSGNNTAARRTVRATMGSGARMRTHQGGGLWSIGISAALVLTGLCAAADAVAAPKADRVYTIANYPVDAVAQNAVAAKEKAHNDGQEAALASLFKRLLPVTAYNRLAELKSIRAGDVIDGVAIRSESNSPTRYIASLDISFQADAIRQALARAGVPYVEQQAPAVVLVPIMREGNTLRSAGGTWSQVWKGLDLDNTLTPLRIEPLQPGGEKSVQGVLDGNATEAQQFTAAYKQPYVLAAIAEIDNVSKRLVVTVAGEDAAGPINWSRAYRMDDGDIAYAMELASVVTQGVLEGRWKSAKIEADGGPMSSNASFGSEVTLEVEFSSNDEWTDLRGRLLDLPGVDDVRVGNVENGTASMSLRYPGGGETLAAKLALEGLSLTPANGVWRLRSGNSPY